MGLWPFPSPPRVPNAHRMVPGAESCGLVAPSICRPTLTAFNPSQTMQTTGPESTGINTRSNVLPPLPPPNILQLLRSKELILNVRDQSGEELFLLEVGIVLLEVVLGGSSELNVSTVGCFKRTLRATSLYPRFSNRAMISPTSLRVSRR